MSTAHRTAPCVDVIVGVGNRRLTVADAGQLVGVRIGIDGGIALGIHRRKDLPRQTVVGGILISVVVRTAGSAVGYIRICRARIGQNVIRTAGVIEMARESSSCHCWNVKENRGRSQFRTEKSPLSSNLLPCT